MITRYLNFAINILDWIGVKICYKIYLHHIATQICVQVNFFLILQWMLHWLYNGYVYKCWCYTPTVYKYPGTLLLCRTEAMSQVLVFSSTSALNLVGMMCSRLLHLCFNQLWFVWPCRINTICVHCLWI